VLATVVIAAYAFVATFLILKLINVFGSIRVPDSMEQKGLDDGEFGETAYNLT
jgi:Amt family ammonium transporter